MQMSDAETCVVAPRKKELLATDKLCAKGMNFQDIG